LAVVVLVRVSPLPAPSSTIQSEPVSVATPIVPARDASPDTAASSGDQAPAAAAAAIDAGVQGTTAAPERPAAASSVTELVVTTQPTGARVTVNGIGWGVTPLAIRHMPPGEKRIRVSKDGYAAEERVLRVDQGRQQVLDIQLNPAP
jgi:hypothetical protein